MRLPNTIDLVLRLSRYNLKIIFANKFVYFLLAAFLFFVVVAAIIFFSSDPEMDTEGIYALLLFPGILFIFYPTAFGIQNDVDTRMIEILFGIPNYRYKVWALRMVLVWVMVFALLLVLAVLSSLALVSVPVLSMVYQLMFPVFFLGCLSFMFSTVIRNGNGTAVAMVVVGMAFWIFYEPLSESRWNIFLNPFRDADNAAVWASTVLKNRIYLTAGTILTLLYGLLNLQKREKYI